MQQKKAIQIYFQRVTAGYLFLMAAVFPLLCGTQGYQKMTAAKYSIFCFFCGGYVVIMLLLAVEGVLVGGIKPVSPVTAFKSSTWTQRFVLLYLICSWASALASPWFPETIPGVSRHEGALTLTIYCLCFLLVSVYGKASKWLLYGLGGSVTVFCVVCLLQFAGYNPFWLYPAGCSYFDADVKYAGEYLGTIGNVDSVAAFLCVVIPIFWIALLRFSEKQRFFLLLPLSLALFVLLRMHVLAGLVGVFAGGLLALPVILPISGRGKGIWAVSLAGLLVAVLAALYFVDVKSGMFHELHQLLHGNFDESFGSGRLHIWSQVIKKIPEHFWLGAGPDTMARADLQAFTRYDEALGGMRVGMIDVAHNEYLNVLYHQGIFALLLYLAALMSAAWNWIRRSGKDSAAAALGGGSLCYCVQAFFGFSVCVTAPFFWLALALLEGKAVNHRKGGKEHVEKAGQP